MAYSHCDLRALLLASADLDVDACCGCNAAADVPRAAVLPGVGVQAQCQPAGRDTCPQLRVPVSVFLSRKP